MEEFELFECSVCMESVLEKEPRILFCGHTFCTPCLEGINQTGHIVCPKCRRETKAGVKALAKNTDLAKMKDRETEILNKSNQKCQMCKSCMNIEYFCGECSKKLICENCAARHKAIPVLRSHQVQPIENRAKEEEAKRKCTQHGEVMKYYCRECCDVLCIVCLCEPNHDNHKEKVVDVDEEEREKKKETERLETLKDELKKARNKTEAGMYKIKNKIKLKIH